MCTHYRSKNDRLAEYNIHELVRGKANASQRSMLYECATRAEDLAGQIHHLKACLMQR